MIRLPIPVQPVFSETEEKDGQFSDIRCSMIGTKTGMLDTLLIILP